MSGPATDSAAQSDLGCETPAPGLRVYQPLRGYRFGVEVYALADFALRGGPADTAIDLGCGSGVVALLLAHAGLRVRAVDREARWTALAARSARESGLDVQVDTVDVRALAGPQVDVAVANPPWFVPGTGPLAPDPWRAASRTMLHGDLCDFAAAGLRVAPRVCVVTRPQRLPDLAHLPGARLSRRACLGETVALVELRRAEGSLDPESLSGAAPAIDIRAAYARFGR